LKNHSTIVNEFNNTDTIKKMKEEIKQRIEQDLKEAYFGNPETLKNILETNNLTFNENNLSESLKTYTTFIFKSLSTYYNYEDVTIQELDSEKVISKLYTTSPYSNIAYFILNKILFLLELNHYVENESNDLS